MTADTKPEPLFQMDNHVKNSKEEATQKCCTSSLKKFLIALSFTYFCKALSGSYMKSSITQIERRFEIPSSVIGVIDGSFEMGNLLVMALISHFGAKFHRPKIIGAGCTLMSVGTLLMALPHFFMGHYQYDSAVSTSANSTISAPCLSPPSELSDTEDPSSSVLIPGCKSHGGSSMWIAVLLGNVLRGIGEATITPLGVSYIDDFTTPENSALYIGILHTISVIGPLFGFTLGSFCAKLYVDIGFLNLESVTISMKDARWVGAWWLGFIIAGGLSLLSALPFWFLPKSVPKEEVDGKGTTTETTEHLNSPEEQSKDHASGQQEPLSDIIKDFLPSMKRLLTNKTYFLYLITSIIMFNASIILITYLPKYFEQQFGESASKANFFIGIANMPAIALGILCSGLIMKKFKLDVYKAMKFSLLTGILGLLATLPLFALSCGNSDIAGVTVSYEGVPVAQPSNLLSTCNSDCHCSTSQWDPVCGENGLTYISPCLAGCKQLQGFGKNTTYQDCRCIASFPSGASNFSSTLGQCPRDQKCSKLFIYYIAFLSLSFFLYSLGSVPMYMLNLRCVEPELKSLAIGIFTMAMRTLAGIPAPIYFGAIIDSVCMIWGVRTCGGRGACRMYQTDNFRYLFLGMILGFRLLGFVIFGFVFFQVRKKFKNDQKESPAEVQLMVKMDTEDRPCGVNVEHLAEKELETSA